MATHPLPSRRGLILAAGTLGFGLSGFFDGIMLHQVLQWHHLLSLVPGETFRDIGTQILFDGLFHVMMYAITAAGLWLLWRRRAGLHEPGAAPTVVGSALLGFGVWNVIDVGFFHWTLGIHRIRIGVPDPMAYDVGWFVAFGLSFLLAGFLVLRRGATTGRGGTTAGAVLSLLAIVAAPLAALPVPGSDGAVMLMRPGAGAGPAISAALAADARILWIDRGGRTMALSLPRTADTGSLYRAGALLVTRSPMLAGCAAAVARTS